MDYFGINSPADLPKIREVLADQIVEGTIVNPEDFTDQPVAEALEIEAIDEMLTEDVSEVTVNEDGELIINAEEEKKEDEDTEQTPE